MFLSPELEHHVYQAREADLEKRLAHRRAAAERCGPEGCRTPTWRSWLRTQYLRWARGGGPRSARPADSALGCCVPA